MNIGIYIYDQAEVLDFSGPFEVFSTASRVCPDGSPFTVFLIGETGTVVTARAGYRVVPAYGIHDHPPIDVLIVAGGVHDAEIRKAGVVAWIARQAKTAKIVASVCTGAFLLAEAGLLAGKNATTHRDDIESLKRRYPDLAVHASVRWVDERSVATSAGISAGIDMSLHLVGRLHSASLARKTARQMEYDWKRSE
ncbi:MAG: DJ-1/PfpI family protein [Desulfobacterales bacterium]|jgi:transcriptional regulator GlxA family with amidase domain